MDIIERAGDLLGGGPFTIALVIAGLVVAFIAFRVVSMFVRLLLFGVALALFLSVAPWSGAPEVTGPVADCARRETTEQLGGWQALATKRVTVKQLSADAQCAQDSSLGRGSATVVLRTFYDVPLGERRITPSG